MAFRSMPRHLSPVLHGPPDGQSGSLHHKARYGRFAGCVHAFVRLYVSDFCPLSAVGVWVRLQLDMTDVPSCCSLRLCVCVCVCVCVCA